MYGIPDSRPLQKCHSLPHPGDLLCVCYGLAKGDGRPPAVCCVAADSTVSYVLTVQQAGVFAVVGKVLSLCLLHMYQASGHL